MTVVARCEDALDQADDVLPLALPASGRAPQAGDRLLPDWLRAGADQQRVKHAPRVAELAVVVLGSRMNILCARSKGTR